MFDFILFQFDINFTIYFDIMLDVNSLYWFYFHDCMNQAYQQSSWWHIKQLWTYNMLVTLLAGTYWDVLLSYVLYWNVPYSHDLSLDVRTDWLQLYWCTVSLHVLLKCALFWTALFDVIYFHPSLLLPLFCSNFRHTHRLNRILVKLLISSFNFKLMHCAPIRSDFLSLFTSFNLICSRIAQCH